MTILDFDARIECRYSGKPQFEFVFKTKMGLCGTASSVLLDSPQAWNLAYLSFSFESDNAHPDPNFTTHVRRSIQTKLSNGTQNLIASDPYSGLVGSLLLLPAPRFVYLIKTLDIVKFIPLYITYGQHWLDTIEKRSRSCSYGRIEEAPLLDLSLGRSVLSKF